MNILPETFKTQLLEESTQTLEAMLVALHDTIISRKKVPVMEEKPVTKEDATGFVDHIEEFVSTEDDLISALTKEAMDFGLHNGIGKPKKVRTQWITSDGESEYKYGRITQEPKALANFPMTKKLLDRMNDDIGITGYFDSMLVSCYRSNSAILHLHADDEEDYMDQDSPIYVFSIGVDRDIEFCLKCGTGPDPILKYTLKQGSLLKMKPGCQQALKHRVPKGTGVNGLRFSFYGKKRVIPRLRLSPIKRTIDAFEEMSRSNVSPSKNSTSWQLENGNSQKSGLSPSHKPTSWQSDNGNAQKSGLTLVIGDSISERLIADKLGKGRKNVVNLSRGGAKIIHVQKQIQNFHDQVGTSQTVEKLFVCVGTNDIRYCRNGVSHLRNHLKRLCSKIKEMYPKAKVFLQPVLPQIAMVRSTINNIL